MAVLKITSPARSPIAPSAAPGQVVPSSSASSAGVRFVMDAVLQVVDLRSFIKMRPLLAAPDAECIPNALNMAREQISRQRTFGEPADLQSFDRVRCRFTWLPIIKRLAQKSELVQMLDDAGFPLSVVVHAHERDRSAAHTG